MIRLIKRLNKSPFVTKRIYHDFMNIGLRNNASVKEYQYSMLLLCSTFKAVLLKSLHYWTINASNY